MCEKARTRRLNFGSRRLIQLIGSTGADLLLIGRRLRLMLPYLYSGSPHRDRSSSPVPTRKDITKIADDKHRKDDNRSSGRSGESYRHSDRQSSRNYHRYDDYNRRDKNVDDYDRGYSKGSYRSARDSREYFRVDTDHRSRDCANDADTYYRTKSEGSGHKGRDKDSYERAGSGRKHTDIDESQKDRDKHREDRGDRYGKTDHRRTSVDHKKDRSPAYEDSKGERNNSSRRDNAGHRLKETSKRDTKDLDSEGYPNDEKRKHDDQGIYKDQEYKQMKEHSDVSSSKVLDSVDKKSKFSGPVDTCPVTDGNSGQAYVTDSDIDAAKIAAMKAAELVNKNLVGTGYMSTDQKKKLLWGNKSTATEESSHRWDTTTFGDRERQEKFNKLMSLRLHWYLWRIVGCEGRRKGRAQVRQSRRGKAEGAAADGIRKAIHSWTASQRWSNCWTWSVDNSCRCSHACVSSCYHRIGLYWMNKLVVVGKTLKVHVGIPLLLNMTHTGFKSCLWYCMLDKSIGYVWNLVILGLSGICTCVWLNEMTRFWNMNRCRY